MLGVTLASTLTLAGVATARLSADVHTVHLGGEPGLRSVNGASSDPNADPSFVGPVDFVLVGSDTRNGQVEAAAGDPGTDNNDVTILVHVSADHRQLTAVSIPRDLVTSLPPCNNTDTGRTSVAAVGMFNEALARGGVRGGLSCVAAAVARLTGIRPQYAALLKFDGVAAITDAVGGVQVCVSKPIHDRYVGLNLPAGEHLITGSDASAFVRSRHGVADGSDLARISNQQVFLSALARKVTRRGGPLYNPVSLYQLAHAALSNMVVSDNLAKVTTVMELARTVQGMSTSNMLFVQYPTIADPQNPNRLVAGPGAAALNIALRDDTPTNLSNSTTGRGATATQGASAPGDSSNATEAPNGATATGPIRTPSPTGPASATSAASTPLPSSITGQSANEATCSVGSGN